MVSSSLGGTVINAKFSVELKRAEHTLIYGHSISMSDAVRQRSEETARTERTLKHAWWCALTTLLELIFLGERVCGRRGKRGSREAALSGIFLLPPGILSGYPWLELCYGVCVVCLLSLFCVLLMFWRHTGQLDSHSGTRRPLLVLARAFCSFILRQTADGRRNFRALIYK